MIKGKGMRDGHPVIVFILEDADIALLKSGGIILQNNKAAGFPDLDILISYTNDGEGTLSALAREGAADQRQKGEH